ncbi:MAG: lipocalin family protein [Pyrinomonadaceae bacterium]|nr:lipocalin family protein [Sphingobacteriaceae bacterium]
MSKLKFSLVLFLGLALVFTGCKTNDPDPQVLIVGKWDAIKITSDSYEDGVKVNTATTTTFTGDDYLEFKSDGTVAFSSPGFIQNGTYNIDGKGERLNVVYQGSTATQVIDVRALTSSELIIHQELPPLVMQNKTHKTVLEGTYRKR